MPLNSRQISRGLLPDSFRFSRLLPMRVRTQAVNFGLQTGQPAVDLGGTGLGIPANLLRFRAGETAGEVSALRSSADPASTSANARSCWLAWAASIPRGPVTTSTRALA